MKCEYCGRILKPSEVTCPGCGAPVEGAQVTSTQATGTNGKTKVEVKVNGINISIDSSDLGNEAYQEPQKQQSNRNNQYTNSGHAMNSEQHTNQQAYHQYASNHRQEPQFVCYGGFWARVIALTIDSVLITLITGFTLGIGALAAIPYFILCESYWGGATIGKKLMGLRVVNRDYTDITLKQSIGRNIGKFLTILCTGYLGFVVVLFSKKKRSIHDCIAATYVIRAR